MKMPGHGQSLRPNTYIIGRGHSAPAERLYDVVIDISTSDWILYYDS